MHVMALRPKAVVMDMVLFPEADDSAFSMACLGREAQETGFAAQRSQGNTSRQLTAAAGGTGT